jgi:hypothetical protein
MRVLHIDLLSSIGQNAARRYGVNVIPATLLFDGHGELILKQVGPPDGSRIRAEVANLYDRTPTD